MSGKFDARSVALKGACSRSAGLRLAPRIDNERGAYLPLTLALHFLCTLVACGIMSTAGEAAQAVKVKAIYIERRRHKQDAVVCVQNIGRCGWAGCCAWQRQQAASLTGRVTDGWIATDVISMQTGLLRAVGDAD